MRFLLSEPISDIERLLTSETDSVRENSRGANQAINIHRDRKMITAKSCKMEILYMVSGI